MKTEVYDEVSEIVKILTSGPTGVYVNVSAYSLVSILNASKALNKLGYNLHVVPQIMEFHADGCFTETLVKILPDKGEQYA